MFTAVAVATVLNLHHLVDKRLVAFNASSLVYPWRLFYYFGLFARLHKHSVA